MKTWIKRILILVAGGVFGTFLLIPFFIHPSLERDWTLDQETLSHTIFNGNGSVSIENIRNIDYETTSTYTPQYYGGTYDPDNIVRAWFLVEPFGSLNAAHTLVSFEFDDGRFLSISTEIRKEKGESFSPIKGLLRQYEIVYVVADERDVIRLRTNYRKDEVRLYPIKGDKQKIQEVFVDMLKRANSLSEKPEMYNTLTNNCTTNIAKHVRKFSDKEIPWWDVRYLFPETVDSLAYDLGLLNTALSFDEAQKYFFITERAQQYDKSPDFSKLIREFEK